MPSGSIFVFPFLVGLACAIYEDQIGILDWNQRFLGKISFVQYDFTSGLSNYFLGSRQNVIASLSRKNGSIAWRQVLESAETLNHFVLCSNVVFSVSSRHSLLRAWDSDLGFLLWEKAFEYPGEITSSDILCDGNRVFLVYPTKLLSFRVNAGERISEIGLKLWPDIPQRVRVMSAKSPSDHIVVVGASFSPSGSTNLMVAVLATPSSSSGDAVIKNVQTHALNSHVDIIK
ncbi:unnamed protein product [Dicrocoelium dendriticum]|nr:unnamed protein product [Dicrocoelium dendriticum]